MTVTRAILQAWSERPEQPVFTFVSEGSAVPISFREQLHRTKIAAAELLKRDVRQGDLIVVITRHRREMIDAFLGALWIGAIPSFMPPPSEKQEQGQFWSSHTELFQRSRVRLLVTDMLAEPENGAWVRAIGCAIWDVTGDWSQVNEEPPLCEPDPRQPAFLQHSSGTTSQKKGIMLSHRAVLAQVHSYSLNLNSAAGETIVSWLPLYHDMGLIACFILPLLKGLHTVLLSPFEWIREPHVLLDAIERCDGRYVWLPNFAFNLLAIAKPPDTKWRLGGVKAFINCSEPCKPDTFRIFQRAFAQSGVRPEQLQVCYAMAETVFAVTQTKLGETVKELPVDAAEFADSARIIEPLGGRPSLTFLSAGSPIEGMSVRIVNERQQRVSDNTVGEIAVSGISVFEGYYGMPNEIRIGEDAWHLTGDLGFLRDGNLFVTGRKRDVLIVRGKKYHGFDIEHIAGSIPGVKPGRCAAFAVENDALGSEDAVLVVELDELTPLFSKTALARTVKSAVYNQLGLMLTEVRIVPPRWISKTTSGKVSRDRNAARYLKEANVQS